MKLIKWIKDAWNDQEEFVNDPTPYDAQIFEGEPGYVAPVLDDDVACFLDEEAESEVEFESDGSYGSVLGMYGPQGNDQLSMGEWMLRGGGSDEGYIPHHNEFLTHGEKKNP